MIDISISIGVVHIVRSNEKNSGKQGHAKQVVKRYGGEGIIEKQEGFIDLSVIVEKN